MGIDLEQLRRDFDMTADAERWTESDKAEIGAAIREAIELGDEEALAGFASDMAIERQMRASFCARIRAFEAAVRAARIA